jgi:hypothetical protein
MKRAKASPSCVSPTSNERVRSRYGDLGVTAWSARLNRDVSLHIADLEDVSLGRSGPVSGRNILGADKK